MTTASFRLNGNPIEIELVESVLPDNSIRTVGTVTTDDGVKLEIEQTRKRNGVVLGHTEIVNGSGAQVDCMAEVTHPMAVSAPCKVQGNVVLKCITDAKGGGLFKDPRSTDVFRFEANGAKLWAGFEDVSMSTSGAGSMQSSKFMQPTPLNNPVTSFGVVFSPRITAGEIVRATFIAQVRANADLDGDGDIDGADLAALVGNWGKAGPTDLNGDGVTNGADLAILIGAWTR